MSRSSAAAFEHAPTNGSSTDDGSASSAQPRWAEDKTPTRPLPVFRLEDEARRLDRAAALASMRRNDDATVTVSPENMKLLASVFADQTAPERMPSPLGVFHNSDDEPTLDAPAPSSPEAIAAMSASRPARVTARPPALKMLVITRPAPVSRPVSASPSATSTIRLPKRDLQTYLVAGIWAMALSLIAVLMFMATSA